METTSKVKLAKNESALSSMDESAFKTVDEIVGLLDNAPVNIMFCTTDRVIRYMNPSSKATLKKLEKYLPIGAEQVEGSCIDIFHKNPAHQKKILADDRNLPINTNIALGPEKLNLSVSAIYGKNKEYLGAEVVWEVITEKLKLEDEMARIHSMMENAPINMMCASIEGTIQYINPKSRETLSQIQKLLPISVDKIVGSSMDVFHKNPSFQKKIISQENNLPHRAKIKLGDETLDLLISPMRDKSGSYVGPVVTWELISDQILLMNTLDEAANRLGAASEELSATATQMTRNSENTSNQSNQAAAASEEVSKGVQVVATNTEEMVASIKEISRSSSEAASISKEAAERAATTNRTIDELGEQSQEIGNVIKVISSIAQQTNLLALNATIEAARAGDAGKGFAVVANEVKELAKQTAQATEEITKKIGAIQDSSKGAVSAIGEITAIIEKLNNISISIAASVEEQTATTNEVSRVVQESRIGVENIADTVRVVAGAAEQSAAGASQTLAAAKNLSELATELKDLVKKVSV